MELSDGSFDQLLNRCSSVQKSSHYAAFDEFTMKLSKAMETYIIDVL